VQDEPRNMGPWPHYQLNVWPAIGRTVEPVTRPASAAPAVGTMKRHIEEQKGLLDRAFAPTNGTTSEY
jgi:2-oxoglutarate dehydrogenase E1 component